MKTWGFCLLVGLAVLSLVACGGGGGGDDGDAGTDGGEDAGPMDAGGGEDSGGGDGGPDDGGSDAGGPECTSGCGIVQLVAGYVHTCALRENGSVWCWGGNREGELGDGSMRHSAECTPDGELEVLDCSAEPQRVVDLPPAVQISAKAGLSTCARTMDDEVYCWGREPIPDPGSGDYVRRFRPEQINGFSGAVDVSDAQTFACAVLDDATVTCLGENQGGQLGDGTNQERLDAAAVSGLTDAVDVEVAAYLGEFGCAITTADVNCWGGNEFRQLGDDSGTHDTCGDFDNERDCSLEPVTVMGLDPPEQLALGFEHACARHSDGTISCWGRNTSSQLGIDMDGPIATPTTVDAVGGVEELAAGAYHTCARIDDGTVRCWGANNFGQLGDGSMSHSEMCSIGGTEGDCSTDPVEVALPGPAAVEIAAGYRHACAVLDDDQVWCWGWNDRRQLGIEDRSIHAMPVQVELP